MARQIVYTGVPEARQEGTMVAFHGDVDPMVLLQESRSTMWSRRKDGWYETEARLLRHDPDGETVIEVPTEDGED